MSRRLQQRVTVTLTDDEDEGSFDSGIQVENPSASKNIRDAALGDLVHQGPHAHLVILSSELTEGLRNRKDGANLQILRIDREQVLVIACDSVEDWNTIAKVARVKIKAMKPERTARLSLVDHVQPLAHFLSNHSTTPAILVAILLSVCGIFIFSGGVVASWKLGQGVVSFLGQMYLAIIFHCEELYSYAYRRITDALLNLEDLALSLLERLLEKRRGSTAICPVI